MLSNVLQRRAELPDKHDNSYSYWSIDPNKVILPNLRLAGVGATINPTGNATIWRLPNESGIAEIIENVYVELDTEKIADNQNLSLYASMINQMRENKRQKNVISVLRRTKLGTISKYEEPINPWGSDGRIKARLLPVDNVLTSNPATTSTGLIHLSDFIEFFNSKDVPYLPYLPNLRIVVEYKDLTREGVLVYPTTAPSSAPTGYTILKPKLIYDEVIDQKSLAQIPRGLKTRYMEPVYEFQTINAVANNVDARQEIRTQGFDGKYLEDLYISLEPASVGAIGQGYNISSAQRFEKIQLVLNGANHLPTEGLDSISKKMLYQVTSRGPLCIPYSGYQYQNNGKHFYLHLGTSTQADRDPDLVLKAGRQSYTTVGVGSPVGSLSVQYSRRGWINDETQQPLNLNLFGRVWRQLEVTPDGRAMLSYVPGFSDEVPMT